ncbi:alpha-hydroxy-acid oxidizing protein [Methylobacterium terricola]|uniref:Alpha-hydroxy-acid oxidizing protein n=1 Tax=Methylobacterium terricola TaxID=2583531 RepID=A0A5C4L6F3_9HYPH|nr:alpha-hydroxy acid oxidase [Methylobacterium terricola]TNC07170.1 alpha-hydroxy-acid oxidizing protein [Methylobacterium terricola]
MDEGTVADVDVPAVPRPRATRETSPKALLDVLCLGDFEAHARRRLPRPLFGYIAGASETNASLAHNNRSYRRYGFRPRVLTDVARRSQRRSLLGSDYAAPFGISPMGISALMAYRGDLVLAQAAEAAHIPMIMSGSSLIRLEDVAAAAPSSWFQAYLPGEPDRIDALVDRVAAAGFGTLVLTVDTATLANRENNIRAGFSTPLRPSLRLAWEGVSHPGWTIGTFLRTLIHHGVPHFENSYATRGAPIIARSVMRDFRKRDHLNWAHLARIRARWSGKLVVKGIIRADDAQAAVACGADGIVVSNHGGRQLDGTMAPLDALPSVVGALKGRAAVMIDGGIARGTDVLKALALGADFVFVGRPFLYAASAFGRHGVSRAIVLLKEEIHRDMALLGINSLAELDESFLWQSDRSPPLG